MTHQHSVTGASSPGWDPYSSAQTYQDPLAQWMQDRQRAFAEFSQSLQPVTKSGDSFFDTAPPSRLLSHDPLFWNTTRPSLISNR